jgi:hypothetical protein
MTTNARKSRHKALLKEVAALIGQPADSLAVELVALAKLKLEGVKLQLLRGGYVRDRHAWIATGNAILLGAVLGMTGLEMPRRRVML